MGTTYQVQAQAGKHTSPHLLRPLLKSKMLLKFKTLIYEAIIIPVWSYGIHIWGPAKPSNIQPIQAFQSINLRLITGAPCFITNETTHKDLKIPTVKELAKIHCKPFHTKLISHPNSLIWNMSSISLPGNVKRRLKRNCSRDLFY
jgi:hypothetical protein